METFEEGFGQVGVNLNKLNFPCLRCLGIHNEVIPNDVLHFGLMPLFMVEHLIIPLNPNYQRDNASKEVPILNSLNKLLRILPPKGLASNENCHSYPSLPHVHVIYLTQGCYSQ